jgi:foldase protein PrsA
MARSWGGRQAALFFVGLAASTALMSGCAGGSKPVASVNGTVLSEKDFAELCETTTQFNPQQPGTVGAQTLGHWVTTQLFAQTAKKLNVYPSEKDLQARVDSIAKNLEVRDSTLDKMLAQQGLTLAAFKRSLLDNMVQENVMFNGVTVSDAEVKEAYEKGKSQFVKPETIKISQMTLTSEKDVKAAQADLASGAQFGLVARTRSKDPFAQQEGKVPQELGHTVQPGGPIAPEVVEAAFKLKPGQVSEPVKVGATWVIVRLDEKTAEKKPSFEDVKEIVRTSVRQQKAQRATQAQQMAGQKAVMDVTKDAKIEINPPQYEALRAQFSQMIQMAGNAGAAPGGAPGAPGLPAGPGTTPGHEGHDH